MYLNRRVGRARTAMSTARAGVARATRTSLSVRCRADRSDDGPVVRRADLADRALRQDSRRAFALRACADECFALVAVEGGGEPEHEVCGGLAAVVGLVFGQEIGFFVSQIELLGDREATIPQARSAAASPAAEVPPIPEPVGVPASTRSRSSRSLRWASAVETAVWAARRAPCDMLRPSTTPTGATHRFAKDPFVRTDFDTLPHAYT